MVKCPDCRSELTRPRKSWIYGVFRVEAYSCDCGTNFQEYTSIHVIVLPSSGSAPKLEKHSFILKWENGRWVKV